ncbi:MAG: DUF1848 domain-containing protein [Acidobacteria bacterium]|nr:DUF1848 domain-containing protein [Acidobacteriota bacterium]
MIISASRRTDIPAFYTPWFMERIRRGFVEVPNPVRLRQVNRISLAPVDVDAIVFWTRDPRPLLPHLAELDLRGYAYYFLFTLLDYPRLLEPFTPAAGEAVDSFRRLADRIGPERVIWRYDPVIFSNLTPPEFHREVFPRLASALRGATRRVIVSRLDVYRKVARQLQALVEENFRLLPLATGDEAAQDTFRCLAATAAAHGMGIQSCAEGAALESCGIAAGRCIDDDLVRTLFNIDVSHRKDPSQRQHCRCVVSRDIGMYDTCLHGCRYCYAMAGRAVCLANRRRHNPGGSTLVPPSPADEAPQ